MADRKKKQRTRSEDPEPFNNPFGTTLKAFRRKLNRIERGLAASSPASRRAPAVVSTGAAAKPPSDSETFLGAVEGSKPLASNARARVRRTQIDGPAVRAQEPKLDLTADEHFDIRFSDRFIRAAAAGVSRETLEKLERGEFAVRSHVDLHGMALDDARQAVDEFLAERHRHGERCVLVITGKGHNSHRRHGVLRERIPEWLARGPSARRVLAFVTARQCDGGEGALYVLLRKGTSTKGRIDVVAGGGA
jgi:DNA-nicking Smr family endonuclease